ncbi:recombinase family protein [Enterococcus gilvus]|uniref:recombinase family protein n=1 Tax=Enterococcus gilvus TaxID=160453 RepID=UPI003D6C142A
MVRQREKRKLEQLREMEQIIIGYARVSSLDDRQKLGYAVQKDALKDCHIVFSEKQHGDNDNRPELTKAIKQLLSSSLK